MLAWGRYLRIGLRVCAGGSPGGEDQVLGGVQRRCVELQSLSEPHSQGFAWSSSSPVGSNTQKSRSKTGNE
ncbi:hypothetical protein J6590_082183 [Homalodisca vitripennis]|nr:hypothetical protein J6590_082183 [Homalodisca vitripennis]